MWIIVSLSGTTIGSLITSSSRSEFQLLLSSRYMNIVGIFYYSNLSNIGMVCALF